MRCIPPPILAVPSELRLLWALMTTDTATPRRTISRRTWIVYCAVCLIFGTTFLAMKIGSNAGMPPFPAAGIRFTAAAVLAGVYLVQRGEGGGRE